MATLERIRRRSGLLIVVIGVAMLGFILTDLLGSGNSIFRGDATVVGRVEGESIDLQKFSRLMEERELLIRQNNPEQASMITRKQVADGVWDELLRDKILGEQYEKLGFEVTSRELYERVKSNPTIQQAPAFKDGVTGQFSEGLFQQYITNIETNSDIDEQAADAFRQWINFESSIKTQSLQNKYNQAIQKGIYYPEELAKELHQRNNTQSNANFILREYASVPDSSIELSDADYKTYYQNNKNDFKTEKLADIQYVNFPISASEADREEVKNELRRYLQPEVINTNGVSDTIPSFQLADDDSLFASSRSDLPVQRDYYKIGNLPAGLDSSLFEEEVGYVTGPYQSGSYFRLSKIVNRKSIPDSAKARHILLSFREIENGNPDRSFDEARELADSLYDILKEDTARFAATARELSDDPGSGTQGGDLGWFDDKTMVRNFSNFVFRNEVGAMQVVATQFGYHIIEILDQGGSTEALQLVNISREIQPSDETLDQVYGEASSFASQVNSIEEFGNKAEELGYQPRPVTGLKPFDENVIGIGNNREIVRWAHEEDTEIGDIQLFSNGSSSYVVVILTDAMAEGYRPLEAVKQSIRPKVLNAARARQLIEEFKTAAEGATKLQDVADKLGLAVNSQTLNFGATTLSSFGNEPKVIGAITGMPVNEISAPIIGERGVYLVQVFGRTTAPELPDYQNEQLERARTTRTRVPTQVFNSLKNSAKIKDYRYKFY